MILDNQQLRQKAKDIKAVLCDVDGTLLNDKKEITEATKAAINGLQQKGIYFTVCSGRVAPMLSVMTNSLNIKGPVVSVNGGLIVEGSKPLFQKRLDKTKAKEIFDFCVKENLDCGAIVSTGGHFTKQSKRSDVFKKYNEQAVKDGLAPLVVTNSNDPDIIDFDDIYKFLIYAKDQQEYDRYRPYFEENFDFFIVSSEKLLIEIMPKGISKGTGVQEIAKILSITPEQIMVFGDFENDIEMFYQAGFAVAMGNATEDIKAVAHYITETNNQDGVAAAINKFLL